MEDGERREDEQQHRRQRVARPELEPEVLARERDDVGRVESESAHASTRPSVASGATRAGSWVESTTCALAGERRELAVEQRGTLLVERRERLVEHEQRRIVQQRPAEREPLRHSARVGRDAVAARVPEAEALEQHPAPLAALGDAVEAAEEVEVLERGQLAVEQRLVPDVPEVGPLAVDLQRAPRRRSEPGDEAQERRLARAVRAGDEQEPAPGDGERDPSQGALAAVPLLEAFSRDHFGSRLPGRPDTSR